jgi:hypothetical protein
MGLLKQDQLCLSCGKVKSYQLVTSLHNTAMTAKENGDFFFFDGQGVLDL